MSRNASRATRLLALVAFAFCLLSARVASAGRSAVIHVGGSVPWMNAAVSHDVRAGLPNTIVDSPSAGLEAELRRRSWASIRRSLATASGRRAITDQMRRLLSRWDQEVVIVVALESRGRSARSARVLVVAAEQPSPVLFQVVQLPVGRNPEARARFWTDLLTPVFPEAAPPAGSDQATAVPKIVLEETPDDSGHAEAPPPSRTSPKVAPPEPPAEASLPESPPTPNETRRSSGEATRPIAGAPHRWQLRAAAAFELSLRRYEHQSEGSAMGRSYQAWPVPGARVRAEAYPVGERFGLELGYARSFGVFSTTFYGKRVETTYSRFDAALKARWFVAKREDAPSVSVLAGYEYLLFGFASSPSDREDPEARYHMLRAGAEARLPVDRFVLLAGAEYDRLVSIGALGNVTASSGGNGVSVRLGTQVEIEPWLFAGIEADYAGIAFALDRQLAQHVFDEYFAVALGPEIVF